MRAEECGESECWPVMGQIEVESLRQHDLTRKWADFHMVFLYEIT